MRRVGLLLALCLLPLAPSAAADWDCVGADISEVCTDEGTHAQGDCGTGGSEAGTTNAYAYLRVAAVYMQGAYACGADGHFRSTSVAVQALFVPSVWVFWFEEARDGHEHGCRTEVHVEVNEVDLGCPAGPPPNPGWGQLLP